MPHIFYCDISDIRFAIYVLYNIAILKSRSISKITHGNDG